MNQSALKGNFFSPDPKWWYDWINIKISVKLTFATFRTHLQEAIEQEKQVSVLAVSS